MQDHSDSYYRYKQIDQFQSNIVSQYNLLSKSISSLSDSIYNIIDCHGVDNFNHCLSRLNISLTQHRYHERNFFRNMEYFIDNQLYHLMKQIKIYLNYSSSDKVREIDEFLYDIRCLLKDYFSIDDRAIYASGKIDSYEEYVTRFAGGNISELSHDLFDISIQHNVLSSRQYVWVRYIIGDYTKNNYLPAIHNTYKKIFYDRYKLEQSLWNLHQRVRKYKENRMYIWSDWVLFLWNTSNEL